MDAWFSQSGSLHTSVHFSPFEKHTHFGSEHFLLQLQANNMSYVPNNFHEDIAYNKREPLVLNRMSSSVLRRFQKSLFWDGVTKWLITHKRLPPMQCYHIVSD